MEKPDLLQLEVKIDTLIHTCEYLAEENKVLRESQANLVSERATLLEKNLLARKRIETMIDRLKSMEAGS